MRPPRRRNDAFATTTNPATNANPTTASSRPDDQDPSINHEPDNTSTERVQILGLHTANPIISYQNQIFSGTWADQLGTELFFARPDNTNPEFDVDDDPETTTPTTKITPLKHTDDYDLISANSVKILGRKANLISNSGSTAATEQRTPVSDTSRMVYKPAHQTNQARFLKKLQDIKQRKGETDTVRTIFSTARARASLEDRPSGWLRTEEQITMIQQLNERAAQGDPRAAEELENIYASLRSQNAGPIAGPSR
ncbi:TFIIIC subunit 6 family protein [Aspergillus undulatus]|uniref:TFIIIC subunit 6 family protein n=1 Tax=Aspergillus undulatus TaxID=1810928 RepID=UPI003CCD64D0